MFPAGQILWDLNLAFYRCRECTVSLTGIAIDRIVEGKVVEKWGEFDQMGMMQQLGVVSRRKTNEGLDLAQIGSL